MLPEDLPSPGYIPTGLALKQAAYRAISYARVQADLTGGAATTGDELRAFFTACAKHCPKSTTKKETA